MKTIRLNIEGMSCASCVNTIESALGKTDGVREARIHITNDTGTVVFDENTLTEQDVLDVVKKSGYTAAVDTPDTGNVTMRVEGMTCASCANRVEQALRELDGVEDVTVNIANDKATFRYDSAQIRLSRIKKVVADAGYTLVMDQKEEEGEDPDQRKMAQAKRRMIYSAVITGPMMLLMVIHMFFLAVPGYTWIVALMAIPVIFWLGRHVHVASYRSLRSLRPNMDVLVSMGSLPPYVIGLAGLFFEITTFMEMATTIMTFHLIGKYLETRAKGKASQAIKKLVELGAKTARIEVDGEEQEVPVDELEIGDLMVVRPGEKIPTDGKVLEGESVIDESIATGESMPVKRRAGDVVIGATINKHGLLKVKVSKTGDDTFLSQVIKMVEACQGSKVPIQEFADKVTGYFVPVIILLTALTFTSFLVFTEFHVRILSVFADYLPWINVDQSPLTLAFITATAVLVIACPCALGLGTPTALMVGSGKGANNGILIRNGAAVQTLKDIKAVAFDKTGTLTYGKPVVTDYKARHDDQHLLYVAASLERGSEHTLAQAVLDKAKELEIKTANVTDFEAVAGQGIRAKLDGKAIFVGSRKLLEANKIDYASMEADMEKLEHEAKTVVLVAEAETLLGYIAIADQLKANAKSVIARIEAMGITTAMITGDNERTANAIARQAGTSHVIASVMPDGKVDEVRKLQDSYGLVAMVGDGINDAPALKQANVGMAIGTGTDVAIEAADVTLVRGDLESILSAIILSRGIFRKIQENFFWAWFYNAVAIPFAMLGLLHPMIGAAAMSVSSLNVVYNSLRLRKLPLQAGVGYEE